MNVLLLAFAIPVATILLSIVLQKILQCPLLVAATFFAVLIIITFAIDPSFLVFAIIYTILAYVTAVLTRIICNIIQRFNLNTSCNCVCGNNNRANDQVIVVTDNNGNTTNCTGNTDDSNMIVGRIGTGRNTEHTNGNNCKSVWHCTRR